MRVFWNGRELHGRKRAMALYCAVGVMMAPVMAVMLYHGHWDALIYPVAGYFIGRSTN